MIKIKNDLADLVLARKCYFSRGIFCGHFNFIFVEDYRLRVKLFKVRGF